MQQERETGSANDQEMKPVQQQQTPQKEKCPRCESFNTKFCYYNNYSLSQPRYFCKTCRRYWTHGGTLRNVPIGGGSRKGKRPKTILSSSSSPATLTQPSLETQQNKLSSTNPGMIATSVSASAGAFSSSCYPRGGYLPSMEAIHQSLNPPPQIFNQSVDVAGILQPAGVAVYSLGSEHNWAHQNMTTVASDGSMWTINDNTASSVGNSSRINNNETSGLIPNPDQWSADDLPDYGHPP